MIRQYLITAAVLVVAGCQSTPSFQSGPDAEITYDGLTRVDNTIMDAVWARTDIDLTSFDKVMFERVAVEFRAIEGGPYSGRAGSGSLSATARNQSYFRLDDVTKQLVVDEISAAFADEIARTEAFEVVDEPGYDVLLIKVALLDIVSRVPPERNARSTVWLDSIGDATLVLEVRDSMSNAIFARAVDRRAAGDRSGSAVQSNRVTNAAEIRRLGRRWAQLVRDGLARLMTEGVRQ
jgi:hypothetical protein